ncbi:hypothetical protein A8709_11045 [Paenibacillus pectinilyticus]|uniref:DNA-binding response regulator n=1 Tax=Paenibacillus pectinilyticus TaxID=512399 RepID=A0A1C1A2G6_9BACL|nr:response regulator [Paenibacillus pectinilyticus]OCT14711.1 hypothetical protein A8709_11045 [Paenibacillus pectinilyticus]
MRILIAEDEKLTRESMERELRSFGYEIIEKAADGVEALAAIESFRPDVVLADIRMPRMDGLRLLQEARKASTSPIFVIVSSYDSFDYAKTALEEGVFAYLLKPVGKSDLRSCLTRVESRIHREAEETNRLTAVDHKAKKYMQLAKKQMLQQWFEEEKTDESELRAQFKAMDIVLPYDRFVVLTVSIDEFEKIAIGKSAADLQLYKYCIENMTLEMIAELGVEILSFEGEHEQGFLVNMPFDPLLEEKMAQTLEKIIEMVSQYLKFTVTVGVGEAVGSLTHIHKSYGQAKQAAMTRMKQGGNRMYVYRNMESKITVAAIVMDFETEQKLLFSMEKCEKENAKDILSGFYRQANDQSENFMKLNFNVAVTLMKLMNRLGMNPEPFLGSELKVYRKLNGCTNLEQLLLTLDGMLDVCFEEIRKNDKIWNNSVMAKAMDYIIHHYNEDISLQSIADHISMSPAYLSKQFKKTYNQNFIEFLIQYRIDKARELLKSGNYTANEVSSLVGIKDEKHFFRTFKKITGVTPGTYKRGKG